MCVCGSPNLLGWHLLQALNAGVLKVMSKMGISTIASYKGAQIFECLGMADEVVNACFVGTASRIAGVGFHGLALDQLNLHAMAYGPKFRSRSMADAMALPNPGDYHWRCGAHTPPPLLSDADWLLYLPTIVMFMRSSS